MNKFLKDIMNEFKSMNKYKKRILIWYIVSLSFILIEYLINSKLNSFVFFHPFIGIATNVFLIVDLFFIPVIYLTIEILKAKKNFIIKCFQILFSGIGMGLLSIIVLFVFSFFHRTIFNTNTVSIEYEGNRIYVENIVWLESSHHVDVYQVEYMLFVRWIDSYKL